MKKKAPTIITEVLKKKIDALGDHIFLSYEEAVKIFDEVYEQDNWNEFSPKLDTICYKTHDSSYRFIDYLYYKTYDFNSRKETFLNYFKKTQKYHKFAEAVLSNGLVKKPNNRCSIFQRWRDASDFVMQIPLKDWNADLVSYCMHHSIKGIIPVLETILKDRQIGGTNYISPSLTFDWDKHEKIDDYINNFLEVVNYIDKKYSPIKISQLLEHGSNYIYHPKFHEFLIKRIEDEKENPQDPKALECLFIVSDQAQYDLKDLLAINNFSHSRYWNFNTSKPYSMYLDFMIPEKVKHYVDFYSDEEKENIAKSTNYPQVSIMFQKEMLKEVSINKQSHKVKVL